MTTQNRTPLSSYIVLLIVVAVSALVLTISRGELLRQTEAVPGQEQEPDIYLPEPHYLKFISLGHDALIADLVLAKALTYYGSHYQARGTFPFRHLKKYFFTALAMDPRNTDAFLLAGNILSDVDVGAAIELLKLGMKHHPQYWKFPEMIGYFYSFRLNDAYRAGYYYELAARLPNHPPYVPSLSGKFYQESGRYEEAIRVLYNFYSTTTDKRLKASFKESIEQIQEKIKHRDFALNATVLKVISPSVVEIQPDASNPHFQFLHSRETLCISDLSHFSIDSSNAQEKLYAYLQLDYADMVLNGSKITVTLEWEGNGRIKRDNQNRLLGTIMRNNNLPYHLLEIPATFPPAPLELAPATIHKLAGQVVTVAFKVQRVEFTREAIYLHSASDYRNVFSAVIALAEVKHFVPADANVKSYFMNLQGRQIVVSGFAMLRELRVEIKLHLSAQLK